MKASKIAETINSICGVNNAEVTCLNAETLKFSISIEDSNVEKYSNKIQALFGNSAVWLDAYGNVIKKNVVKYYEDCEASFAYFRLSI